MYDASYFLNQISIALCVCVYLCVPVCVSKLSIKKLLPYKSNLAKVNNMKHDKQKYLLIMSNMADKSLLRFKQIYLLCRS